MTQDWRALAAAGLAVIPRRSRLYDHLAWTVEQVSLAADWRDGQRRIHARLGEYRHCLVHQEMACLINTLRFANDPGQAIGIQVAQGMDTDSFGCTAGAIHGVRWGQGSLDRAWLAPFQDSLRHGLADLGEWRISAVAARMGDLHRTLRVGPAPVAAAGRDAATGL